MMNDHIKAAVMYFKNGPYDKLLRALRIKYESSGEAVGTISVSALTDGELLALAAFMDMTGPELELRGRLSITKFEDKVDNKFNGVGINQLLSVYFGGSRQVEKDTK